MKRLSSRPEISRAAMCAARHAWLARGILLICLSILFPSPPPAQAQEIIPFSEIKTGMKGFGKTVFNGTKIDDFQVEVIGTLERIAPQRNLILVRLSGGPLANTGVLSGMSGSPVYFNDRLAGAVAYTWGFAREPVAGVTPIQEMLQVEDHETPAGGPAGAHGADHHAAAVQRCARAGGRPAGPHVVVRGPRPRAGRLLLPQSERRCRCEDRPRRRCRYQAGPGRRRDRGDLHRHLSRQGQGDGLRPSAPEPGADRPDH